MKTLLTLAALLALTLGANATVTVNSIATPVPDAFSVVVGGKVTAVGEGASFVFEYGTTLSYGSSSAAETVDPNSYVQIVQSTIDAGLKPNTLYHMRIKAVGTVNKTPVYSGVVTFTTTGPASVVQTSAPTTSSAIVEAGQYSNLNLNINSDGGSYPITYQGGRMA